MSSPILGYPVLNSNTGQIIAGLSICALKVSGKFEPQHKVHLSCRNRSHYPIVLTLFYSYNFLFLDSCKHHQNSFLTDYFIKAMKPRCALTYFFKIQIIHNIRNLSTKTSICINNIAFSESTPLLHSSCSSALISTKNNFRISKLDVILFYLRLLIIHGPLVGHVGLVARERHHNVRAGLKHPRLDTKNPTVSPFPIISVHASSPCPRHTTKFFFHVPYTWDRTGDGRLCGSHVRDTWSKNGRRRGWTAMFPMICRRSIGLEVAWNRNVTRLSLELLHPVLRLLERFLQFSKFKFQYFQIEITFSSCFSCVFHVSTIHSVPNLNTSSMGDSIIIYKTTLLSSKNAICIHRFVILIPRPLLYTLFGNEPIPWIDWGGSACIN